MTHAEQIKHGEWALWWVEEEDEVIAARSEQEAREFYGATDHTKSGPVTWDCEVVDEEGPPMLMSDILVEAADAGWLPAQLTTQYHG